jgi:hypothetical protein
MERPPKLHIIFDDRKIEKYDPLITELKRQRITDFEIFPCILRPNVVASINASHKMIVRMAKESGLKEVCIAEDDLMFKSAHGWSYFVRNKPAEFDIYIGGTYLIDKPETWEPPLVKVKDYVGNHLIIVAEKYYDRFLSVSDNDHIDTAQGGLGDFYVCFPFAALQRPGFSSNNMAIVNYNAPLKEEWVYQ